MERRYVKQLNVDIRALCGNALKLSFGEPGRFLFLAKTLIFQLKAAARRKKCAKEGLHVPAFMIFSVTNKCNLACKGCYVMAQGRGASSEITSEKLTGILKEASELGISITLVSGGEPLARGGLLDILAGFPQALFALFTNGLLLDEISIEKLRKNRHIIPVISIEGGEAFTDSRRGGGTYSGVSTAYSKLKEKNIFFGTSITVTSENYRHIFESGFIREALSSGCGLFFFIEYIPVQEGTDKLILTSVQKEEIKRQVIELQKKNRALLLSFPSGEDIYGGCLAAGRG